MVTLPNRKLGSHGPNVTAIGYGAMGIAAAYGPLKPDAERFDFLDYAYEKGERNFDTSCSYGDSELLIGQWLKNSGKRNDMFIATKFGFVTQPDGSRIIVNTPEHIKEACDKSRKRLGIDTIDLFYCHRLNGKVPIETVVGAMAELKKEGKIRCIGLSEVTAETLRRASKVVHIDAIQMEYSPFSLDIETQGILDAARELGTAIIAYSPLGRGILSGRFKSHDEIPDGDFRKTAPRFSKENFPKNLQLVNKIEELAKTTGITAGQMTLAWLLAQGDDIIPIPGTTSKNNLDENLGALQVKLTKEEIESIRTAVNNADVAGDRYRPEYVDAIMRMAAQ